MRLIVILKSGKYYVCSEHLTNFSNNPYESFRMAVGGTVSIPRDNIEAIERYSDSQIEYVFRPRLGTLEDSDKYEQA